MLAVVNTSHGQVELDKRQVPCIKATEVLVRVHAVAVCGSEIHQWHGTHSWPVRYPVILGHEFSGVVEDVGEEVGGFMCGDRVVSETAAVINPQSEMVRRGLYNLDPDRQGFGYGVDGAMATHVAVPARCLHHVPSEVDLVHAALAEPCCVAYNAVVNHADVRPGDRVLVLGPGPIGILCGMLASLHGAEVAISGLAADHGRLAIAEKLGLTALEGKPDEWAGGYGIDGVIDATGVSSSLCTALRCVRSAGWITKVGWGSEPLNCSLDPLVQKNVTLRGSFSHHYAVWEAVLRLLASGRLAVDGLIGGVWSLRAWEVAFTSMYERRIVKAVLTPNTQEAV